MSTDDTKKGTKGTKPATRRRKPSEKTAQQGADGEVKAAGTPTQKTAPKTAAGTAGRKKAATAGTPKAAGRTKTTETPKAAGQTKTTETPKAAGRTKGTEASNAGSAGTGRKKTPAGQKKTAAAPRDKRRQQPDNIVQFPSGGDRAAKKKAQSAPRRAPVAKADADSDVEGIPVEDAVPQALEAGSIMAEEVGDTIAQVVHMALAVSSMPNIPGVHEDDDVDTFGVDTFGDVLLGLLDRAVIKVRAMALLAPPPRLLKAMLVDPPEGYERLQATCTALGDRLEHIFMQVYSATFSDEGGPTGVDLLTSEQVMDELDETSEAVVLQGDMLRDMAEDIYFEMD